MELLRHCILQVNTICSERKADDPRQVEDVNEYTGTCFRVVPDFLSGCPFYSEDKIYLVTNFHVVDDADDRTVYLRTAAMGKSMFTALQNDKADITYVDQQVAAATGGGTTVVILTGTTTCPTGWEVLNVGRYVISSPTGGSTPIEVCLSSSIPYATNSTGKFPGVNVNFDNLGYIMSGVVPDVFTDCVRCWR